MAATRGALMQSTVQVAAQVAQAERLTGQPCHSTAHTLATPPQAGS